jgi:hypothetical protein
MKDMPFSSLFCQNPSQNHPHGEKLFCQLAILLTCHFVNLPFCQHANLSTCHFVSLPNVNLPLCQLAILSICLFQFAILSTGHVEKALEIPSYILLILDCDYAD